MAIVKHNNPCGTAEQETLARRLPESAGCDPVSAFGGVMAFNRPLDAATAEEVAKLFVECIVAPGYDAGGARKIRGEEKFAAAANAARKRHHRELELKRISGGMLVQEQDRHELTEAELKVVTSGAPTDAEMRALLFGWKVAKHVKSNAIVFRARRADAWALARAR